MRKARNTFVGLACVGVVLAVLQAELLASRRMAIRLLIERNEHSLHHKPTGSHPTNDDADWEMDFQGDEIAPANPAAEPTMAARLKTKD